MSDFDFEEIDKAVSGALQEVSSEESSHTSEAAPQKSSRAPQQDGVTVAPAARRSTGRFMDMVHPSSDMRGSGKIPGLSTPISSQPEPAKGVVAQEPLELDSATSQALPVLESPFLPDTKVEKRPLGGVAHAATFHATAEAFTQPKEELLEAPDEPLLEAHIMPDPIDFSSTQEQSSLVDTPLKVAEEPPILEKETPETNETEPPEVLPEPQPVSPTPIQPPVTREEPIGPTSITQQYTEHPSTEQESGAIYDTEAYHKPLTSAGDKKHGMWVIVWIAILVVIGAAAGGAFYLYILPMF